MNIGTNCKKCLFGHSVSEHSQCDLGIIDIIKDEKKIETKEEYNYIHEYMCRFAFDKEIYDANRSELEKIDMVKLLQERGEIKYYLIIDLDTNDDIEKICEKINNLTIKPKFVSFMIFNYEQTQKLIQVTTDNLDKKIQWKAHNFVEQEELSVKISSVLDTNKRANNSHYLYIIKGSDIDQLENYTMRINTIITIEQKPFHVIMKEKDSAYGLFTSFNHYMILKPLMHQMGLEELSKDPDYLMKYYV